MHITYMKIFIIIFAIFVLFIGLLYTTLIMAIIFIVILLKNKNEMEDYKIIFEGVIIYIYGLLSDYGESIKKPIIIMICLIINTPLVLILTHNFDMFIKSLIEQLSLLDDSYYMPVLIDYPKYFKDVLGAKFYVKNGSSLLETIIFCIYSILMMITTANLYIALRRKLSRK